MDQARVQRAAVLLAGARAGRRPLAGFAESDRPATIDEALAVQDAAMRLNQATPGSWKVGAPPGSRTVYAPIYGSDVFTSPATIPMARHPGMQIEGEVGFVLGRDLPAGGRPYTAEQVADAVSGVCATIEIFESRLAGFTGASIPEKVADNLGNGALVCGKSTSAWRKLDLRALHVTMTVNGRTHLDKTGGKPGDEPFSLLLWAANHLDGGSGMKAGQVVTTGSWTGWYAAQAGDEVVIAFENVGEVRLRCG